MQLVQTVTADNEMMPAGMTEYFIFPESFGKENITNILSKIKNTSMGNWSRIKREVVSITTFDVSKYSALFKGRIKYIKFETLYNNENHYFVIFQQYVDHDCMAEVVKRLGIDDMLYPVSAGFTDFDSCYGRSMTLNIDSDQYDTEYLREEIL